MSRHAIPFSIIHVWLRLFYRTANICGQRRSLRGGPDMKFYEKIGRTNFELVASHATARRCELDDVFEELADRFREVRIALNHLSDQLLNLDDPAAAGRSSLSL